MDFKANCSSILVLLDSINSDNQDFINNVNGIYNVVKELRTKWTDQTSIDFESSINTYLGELMNHAKTTESLMTSIKSVTDKYYQRDSESSRI